MSMLSTTPRKVNICCNNLEIKLPKGSERSEICLNEYFNGSPTEDITRKYLFALRQHCMYLFSAWICLPNCIYCTRNTFAPHATVYRSNDAYFSS